MDEIRNTGYESYDDDTEDEASLSQEEILMSESDILAGLLELGRSKDEKSNYHNIQIKREGKVKLEFRIRPITEDEVQSCLRKATKYAKAKSGQPKVAIETDSAIFRSIMIYNATVDEDRAKTWDNRQAQEALGVLRGIDMIDRVLLAGEKSRVVDAIEEISAYNDEAEELAGN
jgi:molybdopterin/thiamine biosynthesis adenylyltransferase